MSKITAHSEYGFLKKVFVKDVPNAFINQDYLDEQWDDLNYLNRPDYDLGKDEFLNFESALESKGAHLLYFNKNREVTIDSLYCRDSSIMTDHGIILCNMGKPARSKEPRACKVDFEVTGVPILGEIKSPGTVEGGDVAWVDEKTLAVGHGYRTNEDGFIQLKNILEPFDISLIQVDLPHYKGMADVFHLMSIFSPIDAKKAVVYSPLMSVRFRNFLLKRNFELIDVPDHEFESMGCNVLAIAPSVCIIVKGNPETKVKLEEAGCEVLEWGRD